MPEMVGDLVDGSHRQGEYNLAHPPAFHLIDVPKTWLGVRPEGQDSASPRLPVRMGGLAGGLSLTSRVGLVLMYTARAKHPGSRERC